MDSCLEIEGVIRRVVNYSEDELIEGGGEGGSLFVRSEDELIDNMNLELAKLSKQLPCSRKLLKIGKKEVFKYIKVMSTDLCFFINDFFSSFSQSKGTCTSAVKFEG